MLAGLFLFVRNVRYIAVVIMKGGPFGSPFFVCLVVFLSGDFPSVLLCKDAGSVYLFDILWVFQVLNIVLLAIFIFDYESRGAPLSA